MKAKTDDPRLSNLFNSQGQGARLATIPVQWQRFHEADGRLCQQGHVVGSSFLAAIEVLLFNCYK